MGFSTIQDVKQLEAELGRKRREVAAALKSQRAQRKLSLRQVARRVRLTPTALMSIEMGDSWKTSTVARVVKFYERTAA